LRVTIEFENEQDRQMLGVSAGSNYMTARVTAVLLRHEALPLSLEGTTTPVYRRYIEIEIGTLEEKERPGQEALRLLGEAKGWLPL